MQGISNTNALFGPFLWVALALAVTLLPSNAAAQSSIISAPDAATMLGDDGIVLLDIRSPAEWKESGVAKGAWPVSMHQPGFPERLQALLQHAGPQNVALICATGGRSEFVVDILERNGISGVIDVSEGMFGNGRAPGWIARGLPIVTADDALDLLEARRTELDLW